jgi:hypothetical protein
VLTLPPHTSHKLQPLDVSVFFPFKRAFKSFVDDHLYESTSRSRAPNEKSNKMFTIFEIAEAVCHAYMMSFTPKNIISGFRSTGTLTLYEK